MSVFRLILREVVHRRTNFLLVLAADTIAVACLIGAMTLLSADDIRTTEILQQRQEEVDAAGKALEDEIRKSMTKLGFNILILPGNQDLHEFHTRGTLSETMPEEFVNRLAESSIVTVNHLLPQVTSHVEWPEREVEVILVGTRGEVPIMHRDPKKPLLEQVPPGQMVVGFEVQKKLNLSKGDEVTFRGKKYTISETHAQRGTSDDSTVWVHLTEAQELLGMQNLINAILALECNCAAQDRVAEIRDEIAKILPGTQIMEVGPPALARAEARNRAKKEAEEAKAREEISRAQQQQQREAFAAILVPLVIIACAVSIGLLTLTNVRQRTAEIGILRAIGLRSLQIMAIFLGKSLLIGLLGAGLGYLLGFVIGVAGGELPASWETATLLFDPATLVAALILAPCLSGIASWIPSMLAARQDPALVLQEV